MHVVKTEPPLGAKLLTGALRDSSHRLPQPAQFIAASRRAPAGGAPAAAEQLHAEHAAHAGQNQRQAKQAPDPAEDVEPAARKARETEVRVSTTDPEARVMKMADGDFAKLEDIEVLAVSGVTVYASGACRSE